MQYSRLSLRNRSAVWWTRCRHAAAVLLLSGLVASVHAPVVTAANAAPLEQAAVSGPIAAAIVEASRRFGIPEHWLRAIMRIESRGALHATSSKGAMGLMQIMPATWTELRTRYGLGSNPYDLRENILAGAAYVREMHDRYGAPGFLAAYNAGPGRYEEFLSTGRPLPAETQNYVALLAPAISDYDGYLPASRLSNLDSWTRAPLFVGRADSAFAIDRIAKNRQRERHTNARPVVDISAIVPRSDGLFPHGIRPEGGL